MADRYAIERELGSGGMATVYLARDLKLGRKVAIKVLKPEIAALSGPDRFLREIRLTARITHPHIVTLIDSGQADGIPFFVMEYVEGETLAERLRREGQLPVEEALQIVREVADALTAAHNRGIVHRDIKPANILLDEGHAIVTDFGIGTGLQDVDDTLRTTTGVSLGTPGYMSPEQATGSTHLDGRSDIYSLGCVLHEMLAGERPFIGGSPQAIFAKQLTQSPPSVSIFRDSVPSGVESAIRRALARAPADRFQTAADFADALTMVSGATPTLPSGLGLADGEAAGPVRRPGRGSPATRAAIVALAGGVSLIGAIKVWQWIDGGNADSGVTGPPAASKIAVLPVAVAEGSNDLTAFAANLTGRLIEGLSAINALTVISERGVRPYADRNIPMRNVVEDLEVGTLIDCILERYGDSVRVRVQLIDGITSAQIGSNVVEEWFQQRLRLVDAVADTVTRLLRLALGSSIQRRQRLLQTDNMEAFAAVEAAAEMHKEFERLIDRGSELIAAARIAGQVDSLLARAESLDPGWVEPTVRRAAWVEHREMLAIAREEDTEALLLTGIDHATRALRKQPRCFDALEIRGKLYHRLSLLTRADDPAEADSLLAAAEADLRASIIGNPMPAGAYLALSRVIDARGDPEEAHEFGQLAYESDPYLEQAEQTLLRLFEYSFALSRDEEANRWCAEGRDRFGDLPIFLDCYLQLMAWTEVPAAQPDEAWRLVELLRTEYPPSLWPRLRPRLQMIVAGTLVRASRTPPARPELADSARSIAQRIAVDGLTDFGVVTTYAAVLDRLGDRDEAVAVLRDYLDQHPEHGELLLRQRPLMPLLSDPVIRESLLRRPIIGAP